MGGTIPDELTPEERAALLQAKTQAQPQPQPAGGGGGLNLLPQGMSDYFGQQSGYPGVTKGQYFGAYFNDLGNASIAVGQGKPYSGSIAQQISRLGDSELRDLQKQKLKLGIDAARSDLEGWETFFSGGAVGPSPLEIPSSAGADKTVKPTSTQVAQTVRARTQLTAEELALINRQPTIAMKKKLYERIINSKTDNVTGRHRTVTGQEAADMGLNPAKIYSIGANNEVDEIGDASSDFTVGAADTDFSAVEGRLGRQLTDAEKTIWANTPDGASRRDLFIEMAKTTKETTSQTRRDGSALRAEYTEKTKDMVSTIRNADRAKGMLKNALSGNIGPAEQLELINRFISTVDKRGAVRPSDTDMVAQFNSSIDAIKLSVKKALKQGDFMTAKVQAAIARQLIDMGRTAEKLLASEKRAYTELGKEYGVPSSMIFGGGASTPQESLDIINQILQGN